MGVSQIILKVCQPNIISALIFEKILMSIFFYNMPIRYKFAEKKKHSPIKMAAVAKNRGVFF
jgi:hypothetical protein